MCVKVLIIALAISSVARADSSSEEAGQRVPYQYVTQKHATYGPVQPEYTTTTETANSHSYIGCGSPTHVHYAHRPMYVREEKPTYVNAPSPVAHTVYRTESKPVTKYVKLVQQESESSKSEEYPNVHTVYRTESKPVTKYVKLVQQESESSESAEDYPSAHTVHAYAPAPAVHSAHKYAAAPAPGLHSVHKYAPASTVHSVHKYAAAPAAAGHRVHKYAHVPSVHSVHKYAPAPSVHSVHKYAPAPAVHSVHKYTPTPAAHRVHKYAPAPAPAIHSDHKYNHAPSPAAHTYAPAPVEVLRTYTSQPVYAPRQVVKYTPAEPKYVKKTNYVKQVPAYTPKSTYTSKASYAPKYQETYEDANYDFTWAVTAVTPTEQYGSGETYERQETAEYGHTESRRYDKTTGKYWVQLPDGRLQTVEYIVDGGSGYLAKVSYSGDAKYSISHD